MSALARYFNSEGCQVAGYDRTSTKLTDALQQEGIAVHFEAQPEKIETDTDLVIYTPAVPDDFAEMQQVRAMKLPLHKRAEVLGMISQDRFTIAVAGSHGKTTVCSLIAHILETSGKGCAAFLGGVTLNYNSNFLHSAKEPVVVEADEFDRSFLCLHPDIAVVTAIDTDHLDIYGDRGAVEEAFAGFVGQIRKGGKLIARWGLDAHEYFSGRSTSYSLTESTADFHTRELDAGAAGSVFQTNKTGRQFEMKWPGIHNVENALAAIAVADALDIPEHKVAEALLSFKGIARRYQKIIDREDCVYIDDYAHHPEEINALLHTVRRVYWDRKILVVFQPHLYSRTRDLAADFADALLHADEVLLLNIYPARELPIEGVHSEMLAQQMRTQQPDFPVRVVSPEELIGQLETTNPSLLLTVGAGDIDKLVTPIQEVLSKTAST